MTGMLPEQRAPVLVRVLARSVSQLVEEAFDDERGVGVSDGAPKMHRDAGWSLVPVHQHIGNLIGQIRGPFDGGSVYAVFNHFFLERGAYHEGLTDDPLLPRYGVSRRVQTGRECVINH